MKQNLYITHWCIIRDNKVIMDEIITDFTENFVNFAAFAKSLYKGENLNYPKFYKMDNLSKLAFLAAENIFKKSDVLQHIDPEKIGVVMANSVSSLDTDISYQATISDKENYFPSPAVFVYTLPNILIGEICIRHKIKGENAFLIFEEFDPIQFERHIGGMMETNRTEAVLCGWVNMLADHWDTCLFLVEKESNSEMAKHFTIENLTFLYQK